VPKLWPQKFEEYILQFLKEDAGYFFESLPKVPVSAAHLNKFKPSKAFETGVEVPWNLQGRLLPQKPNYLLDPLFHAGAYMVQESSNQFISHVLSQAFPNSTNPVVLDLFASSGGKSVHLLDALNGKGTLIANEMVKSRLRNLEENLLRNGAANVLIANNEPIDYGKLKEFFDLIVIDAPCSDEGLFRKNPNSVKEWSESAVSACVGIQQRILSEILPTLKQGGMLIYTTNTYNVRENEENVKWLLDQMNLEAYPILIKEDWGILQEEQFMFRFLPHLVQGEGLFMAVLQKPILHETFGSNRNLKKSKLPFIPPKKTGFLLPWLNSSEQFEFLTFGTSVYALPKHCISILEDTLFHLNILKSGIKMGSTDKNNALLPEHELGLNQFFTSEFDKWELELGTAISYLKKQVLQVPIGIGVGWQLVTFQGLGIGFAKVMPGRMNNYLPSELRIIKDTTE